MYYSFCTASMSSGTIAQKAQRLLHSNGIDARVVKLDAEKSRRGCSYGVEFSCAQLEKAKSILRRGGAEAKSFYSGDERL